MKWHWHALQEESIPYSILYIPMFCSGTSHKLIRSNAFISSRSKRNTRDKLPIEELLVMRLLWTFLRGAQNVRKRLAILCHSNNVNRCGASSKLVCAHNRQCDFRVQVWLCWARIRAQLIQGLEWWAVRFSSCWRIFSYDTLGFRLFYCDSMGDLLHFQHHLHYYRTSYVP